MLLEIELIVGDNPGTWNQAELLFSMGNLSSALRTADEALVEFKKGKNRSYIAYSLSTKAKVKMELKEFFSAREFLNEAKEIYQSRTPGCCC